MLGKQLSNGVIDPVLNEIDFEGLNAGVYFITISNNFHTQTERIILQ